VAYFIWATLYTTLIILLSFTISYRHSTHSTHNLNEKLILKITIKSQEKAKTVNNADHE